MGRRMSASDGSSAGPFGAVPHGKFRCVWTIGGKCLSKFADYTSEIAFSVVATRVSDYVLSAARNTVPHSSAGPYSGKPHRSSV